MQYNSSSNWIDVNGKENNEQNVLFLFELEQFHLLQLSNDDYLLFICMAYCVIYYW